MSAVGTKTDVLIRNIDEQTLWRLDAEADRLGLSPTSTPAARLWEVLGCQPGHLLDWVLGSGASCQLRRPLTCDATRC